MAYDIIEHCRYEDSAMKPINPLSGNRHSRHYPALALLLFLSVPFIAFVCSRKYSEAKHPAVEICCIIDCLTSEWKGKDCCSWAIYDSIPALTRTGRTLSKASFEGILLAEGAKISRTGSHEDVPARIELEGLESGPDILDIYVYIDLYGKYIDLQDYIVRHYNLTLVSEDGGYCYHQCIYRSSDELFYGTISSFGNRAGSYDIIVGRDYDRVSSFMEFGETVSITEEP